MTKEPVIKADEIVSKHDLSDLTIGKVVMALGIGALFGDKLRKAAKYLIIGGALLQVPATLRISKKAVQFAKQIKKAKAAEAEQEKPSEETPTEENEQDAVVASTATEANAEAVVAPEVEESVITEPNLDHLNHPEDPSSHPHEDPTN